MLRRRPNSASEKPVQEEPVVARKSRQLTTQKPPVTERNEGSAEVPPKAAGHRQAA
jgi:hypothetical protein